MTSCVKGNHGALNISLEGIIMPLIPNRTPALMQYRSIDLILALQNNLHLMWESIWFFEAKIGPCLFSNNCLYCFFQVTASSITTSGVFMESSAPHSPFCTPIFLSLANPLYAYMCMGVGKVGGGKLLQTLQLSTILYVFLNGWVHGWGNCHQVRSNEWKLSWLTYMGQGHLPSWVFGALLVFNGVSESKSLETLFNLC